jgi:hypothetical protein
VIEEYPRNLIELEAAFSTEAASRDYLARQRRAGWLSLSSLWRRKGVADAECAVSMCGLRPPSLSDRRNDLSRYANPAAGMVSRHVVGDGAEEQLWDWVVQFHF